MLLVWVPGVSFYAFSHCSICYSSKLLCILNYLKQKQESQIMTSIFLEMGSFLGLLPTEQHKVTRYLRGVVSFVCSLEVFLLNVYLVSHSQMPLPSSPSASRTEFQLLEPTDLPKRHMWIQLQRWIMLISTGDPLSSYANLQKNLQLEEEQNGKHHRTFWFPEQPQWISQLWNLMLGKMVSFPELKRHVFVFPYLKYHVVLW